jgi:hypothetical protein
MGIAIRLAQTGGPNVLKAESITEAQPGPDEMSTRHPHRETNNHRRAAPIRWVAFGSSPM